MLIEMGQSAPDFELKDSAGDMFRLSDVRGHKRVMLVFYPKDMTGG